jgi:hypothetical protein
VEGTQHHRLRPQAAGNRAGEVDGLRRWERQQDQIGFGGGAGGLLDDPIDGAGLVRFLGQFAPRVATDAVEVIPGAGARPIEAPTVPVPRISSRTGSVMVPPSQSVRKPANS